MGVRYQRAVDLVELTGILQTTVTGLSIDEISERFEVSRRTAERMLSALRDRFPDLEPIFRGGRKYWKLPPASRARPLQLPRTLETLSERIVELEAEISMSRHYAEAAGSDDTWATFLETYLSGSEADYQAAVRKFAEEQAAAKSAAEGTAK